MKNTKKQVFGIVGAGSLATSVMTRMMNEASKSPVQLVTSQKKHKRILINAESIEQLQKKISEEKRKRTNKNLLLADLALLLILETNPQSETARLIEKQRSSIERRWGKVFEDITQLKQIIGTLAEKLVACEDVAMVVHTLSAIQAINTGDMLIADDDQIIQ